MQSRGKLPTRTLGKAGLAVTIVGLGGIPILAAPEKEAVAAIQRAHDLGVNFFDTARSYGPSEEYIGKALEGREYIAATKSEEQDAESISREIEESLKNLRRDRIEIYQLHWVADDEALNRVLEPGGAVEGMRRARDQGKISHMGITGHSRGVLMRAVERCDDFATVCTGHFAVEPLWPCCEGTAAVPWSSYLAEG